ncbi:MAG: hemolysin family protein [Actinobacteria bacterium]|nr:hemolysin family protein [Actinomycetota bacterium]MCL6096034.1 hemolysin family protein [Actinomycetota bacterium]
MSRSSPWLWVLVAAVVVLVVISAVLALAETSLVRTSKAKALSLVEEGRRGATKLLGLVEHPERFLNTILLAVLFCQLAVATIVGVVANDLFGAMGVVVGLVLQVVVIFLFAELGPKLWAVAHVERAALITAPLVSVIVNFLPVRMVSEGLVRLIALAIPEVTERTSTDVTESELLAMADVAESEDVIETEERALIHSIIEFGDTVVREVMVPRPDVVAVEASTTVGEAIEIAMQAGFSRLPVYEGNLDGVLGIAYVKDLMRADHLGRGGEEVRLLKRTAHFVPENKSVASLMREMQAEKYHLAVVVDEYGSTAGIVTLEDLIEELVGEIVDEFDVEEPLLERLGQDTYRVNARMVIGQVNQLLGVDLPTGDWDTVGGMLLNILGHVPTEGESVEVDGHRLVVEKMQGRRIGRVRIAPLSPQ